MKPYLLMLPILLGLTGLANAEETSKLPPGDVNALAAVRAAMKDQYNPKTPYRMEIIAPYGEGKAFKNIGVVESTERKSIEFNLINNKITKITYDQNVWIIQNGAAPRKMSDLAAMQTLEKAKKMAKPESLDIGEAKALPDESLGGVSMKVLSYRMMMWFTDSFCTIWVNPQGQVMKEDSESTDISGSKSVTHTTFTYDPSLKVVPPEASDSNGRDH